MLRLRLLSVLVLLVAFVFVLLSEAGPLPNPRAVLRQKKVVEEEDEKPIKKKGKIVEEEDNKPTKKKSVEEEDDKPAKKKSVEVDDDKPAPPSVVVRAVDLAAAARDAQNKELKALYLKFVVPSDHIKRLHLRRIRPLSFYIKDASRIKDTISVEILDDKGQQVTTEKAAPGSVSAIYYYEKDALDAVRAMLALDFQPSSDRYIAPYDKLIAAETVLTAVWRQHQSWVERKIREGEGWPEVAAELRHELLGVLLKRLALLVKSKSWDQGFELARYTLETFRLPKEHEQIANPVGELLAGALADTTLGKEQLKEARAKLRFFQSEFPNNRAINQVSKRVREQAETLFERAKMLKTAGKNADALDAMRQAQEIWPELPGLNTILGQAEERAQLLRISARELPKYHSPAYATTDAELRSVDLLFESLVVLAPNEQGMLYYRPSLAEGRIGVVPLGREFRLPRNAKWSNGDELTAADIGACVEQITAAKERTGRSAAWGELLAKNRVEGDPFKVRLLLKQGYLDPLAAMSFKVVPVNKPAYTKDFAEKPTGSGPFVLEGTKSDDNRRTYLGYQANQHYAGRGDRTGLPRIREVRFYNSDDPVKDLKAGVVDLALDLTADQADQAAKAGFEVPMPINDGSVNRRIYFLAVNNRVGGLEEADLRVALALAIDREGLLDKHFRGPLERKVHKALNGPYPAKSWACNPKLFNRKEALSLDPYDPDLARAKAAPIVKKVGGSKELTLKYPSGDKTLQAAIEDLCERVNKELPGVVLKPEPCQPHALREDIETTSFQLAYCWYDFPDESFWLKPLLGATGYNGALALKVEAVMNHRNFSEVRNQAHAIHQLHLQSEMPFVPLWQLDPLYAHKKNRLETVPFEAYHMFARIEQWQTRGGK